LGKIKVGHGRIIPVHLAYQLSWRVLRRLAGDAIPPLVIGARGWTIVHASAFTMCNVTPLQKWNVAANSNCDPTTSPSGKAICAGALMRAGSRSGILGVYQPAPAARVRKGSFTPRDQETVWGKGWLDDDKA